MIDRLLDALGLILTYDTLTSGCMHMDILQEFRVYLVRYSPMID